MIDQMIQKRRNNAMANFIDLVAKTRNEQMHGKHGGPVKQSNAANIVALKASALKLRGAA